MPDGTALPGWPRALREEWAAAYVGLSPSTFRQAVVPAVQAVRLTAGRVAWLREDLDAWLEGRRAPRENHVDGATAEAKPPPEETWNARDANAEALARLAAKGRSRRADKAR
ncbi:hypothetical protein HB662_01430 [Roseomonas frigidaquae]|uniref:Helix-turn-helix domain-containing protein n=1 Tax=Falsiroseomonas frigidaquae TaxID=487318 RepID=A0ABX1ES12_9PROT|nr:hypothetical protein [Falsiroseomonas frigidaquae]NKE43421.1 hypothetical protein [Falsiroseomonas frigidaquae]